MNKKTKVQNLRKVCITLHFWLIVVATIGIIGITGCVPPINNSTGQRAGRKEMQTANTSYTKSKKYKNYYKNEQKKTTNEEDYANSTHNYNDDIIEFDKNINNNNIFEEKAKSKALPSLKEQMEEIMQRQDANDENINNIKGDLLEIKEIISNIAAEKFKTTVSNGSALATPTAVSAGPVTDYPQSHAIIKSDEQGHNPWIDYPPDNNETPDNINQINEPTEQKTAPKPKVEEKPVPKQNKNFKIVKAKTTTKSKEKPQNETKNDELAQTTGTNNKAEDNDFSNIIATIAKKDYNTAVKQISSKIKSTKNSTTIANCYYWLGECSFNQRDYAKSIEYYKKALDNNQCDKKDVAQVKIAESYLRVGKNNEAKVAYQTLLKEHPRSSHSPKAKKMLQQL